jgi:hypothetical protein
VAATARLAAAVTALMLVVPGAGSPRPQRSRAQHHRTPYTAWSPRLSHRVSGRDSEG